MEDANEAPLYIQIYEYYKSRIIEGTLGTGVKLPSIRRCAIERRVSKTTIEAAYAQLVAEGYLIAQPGSGFYVSELDYQFLTKGKLVGVPKHTYDREKVYDFATSRVDFKSFNFDIWRRYIKSALRNTERLLSYGEPQGEYDLREEICNYIREKRGVVCMPEQIIIGASMQTLFHLLCSLIEIKGPIAFTGSSYKQGKIVFEDRGVETLDYGILTEELLGLETKGVKVLYTSPSHATPWGEAMNMKTRLALLRFAKKNNCLILEDDYDSEFNYYTRPTPALQGIDGGKSVIYMSTFSKLLLPSLRLSFMVLPLELIDSYENKGKYYNQTASKVEQIALCQFIRDGHFEKQIKKARRLYLHKKQVLCECVENIFGELVKVNSGNGGFLIEIEIKKEISIEELLEKAAKQGILIKKSEQGIGGYPKILLSCSGIELEDFEQALETLKRILVMDGLVNSREYKF
ncbi:MAG: PLP-dependent aminotransferase family protein [Cellulosilyticaceae bacterium]